MSLFLALRRQLLTMILLTTVGLLFGCMFVAHHGHGNPSQEGSSHEHKTSEENEGVAAAHQEEVDAAKTHDGHDGMPMMHGGSGGWRWLMGGAMVVMMVVVML